MKTRANLLDTLATCNVVVDLARQERAAAGFDTLASSRVALEKALAARSLAVDELAARDAT